MPSRFLLEGGTDIRKIQTTALYTRVATGTIAAIESPLDPPSQPRKKARNRPKPSKPRKDPPPA
jgi:hypothetical protein